MKKKIYRTFLRSKPTMDRYIAYVKDRLTMDNPPNPFADLESVALKSFKHWVIVPNNFPYDAIATVSHLLFTKRTVAFNWSLLTKKELLELEELKKGYLHDNYDVLWENLPRGQSVPGHFHLQLLVTKQEEVEY